MRYFTIAFLFICISFSAKATHIVGGEIGYKCLGNDQYEITLTVYRDCFYGEPLFDSPASIGFFLSGVDTATYELKIEDTFSDTIVYVLEDPCLSIPPDVCVEVMQYVDTITLPFVQGGYSIVYQRCCRNETLLNIQNPLETGASFVVEMTEASMLLCNSSPVYSQWPPIALCVDKQLDFDHSASDLEGDSIVYSICAPFIGGQHSNFGNPMPQPPEYPIAEEVKWINPPYNVQNMLGGVPLSIDPVTGQLTAIPNTIGQFVVGVCMHEYRDGVPLSVTKRDFQFNVSDCGEVVSSFFVPSLQCDELTIDLDNLSENALSYYWDFGVLNIDSDTSILANPTYSYPDTGQYVITLISVRSESCIDTFVKSINLQYTTFDIGVDWDVIGCGDSLAIQIMDQTVDSIYETKSWLWELINDIASVSSTDQQASLTIPAGSNTVLHGTIESTNGCQKEIEIPFTIPVIADLPDTVVLVCRGEDVMLNPNPVDSLTYFWTPSAGLSDPNTPSPLVTDIQEDQMYFVEVNDLDSICMRNFEVNIFVSEVADIFAQANPDTIFIGESSQLSGSGTATSFLWDPAGSLNNETIQNPIATPSETTDYQFVGWGGSGCPDSTTVRVVVLNPECGLPNVFVPTGFTPDGDGLNDDFKVYGFIVETMQLMVYNRWGEKVFETSSQSTGWDGTFNGKKLPPDVYGFYLKVGCINGEQYEHKGNVTLIR